MKKTDCAVVKTGKGEAGIYDFGTVKLYAYKTNDPIDDEVFILAKDKKAVVIESPCFFDNNLELEAFMRNEGLEPAGMLLSYHLAGGTFLRGVPKYATERAIEYGRTGGGGGLIAGFAETFGDIFDASKHVITNVIGAGPVEIAGIKFEIVPTADAFDIVIPEINAVYTHMLGHDCHSIVAGAGHADAIITQLGEYLKKGYALVLTSHYTPEDLKDVETKIAYLRELKALAAKSRDKDEFTAAMKSRFPAYAGDHYLGITAGIFFG